MELAKSGSREIVIELMVSARAQSLARVREELARNPHLTPAELALLTPQTQQAAVPTGDVATEEPVSRK